MGIALALIFALIVIGFVLIFLEIFVLPGISVTGIVGSMMVLAAIYFSYKLAAPLGHIMLTGAIIFTVILLRMMLKKKTWNKVSLHSQLNTKAVEGFNQINLGDEGIAMSRLSPIGTAKFNQKLLEVESISGLIESGEKIVISAIEQNKIFIKKI
jgi:membrane-bound ClpP family serine protease